MECGPEIVRQLKGYSMCAIRGKMVDRSKALVLVTDLRDGPAEEVRVQS